MSLIKTSVTIGLILAEFAGLVGFFRLAGKQGDWTLKLTDYLRKIDILGMPLKEIGAKNHFGVLRTLDHELFYVGE